MLGMVLLLSGCSNTKLSCYKSEEQKHTYNFNQTYTFKNDKIDVITQELEVTSIYDLDEEIESLEKLEAKYKNEKGIKITSNRTTNNLLIKVEIDRSLVTEKELKELIELKDLNISYKEVKEKLETDGYSCK